jgi:hypothetical protein
MNAKEKKESPEKFYLYSKFYIATHLKNIMEKIKIRYEMVPTVVLLPLETIKYQIKIT